VTNQLAAFGRKQSTDIKLSLEELELKMVSTAFSTENIAFSEHSWDMM